MTTEFPSVHRVLTAAATATAPAAWLDRAAVIADERAAIDAVLAAADPPRVYGFTTLLGHLDGTDMAPQDQRTLLRNHLLGTCAPIDPLAFRLITACKAQQLSQGGSGISAPSYRAVVALPEPDSTAGAWFASYGSGDVVPAAWWVHRLGPDLDPTEHVGDLIALINGHFVSSAVAIAALCSAAESLAVFLAHYTRFGTRSPEPGPGRRIEAIVDRCRPHTVDHRQKPVSFREAAPVIAPMVDALVRVCSALEDRLDRPSANPLFHRRDGAPIAAFSQSGFLDYGLTFANTNLTQALHLALGVTHRMAVALTSGAGPDPVVARDALIQAPKVVNAIVDRAAMTAGGLPSRFTDGDSDGVEDARDLSALSALQVLELSTLLDQALEILAQAGAAVGHSPAPTAEMLEPLIAEALDVDADTIGPFARAAASLRR